MIRLSNARMHECSFAVLANVIYVLINWYELCCDHIIFTSLEIGLEPIVSQSIFIGTPK